MAEWTQLLLITLTNYSWMRSKLSSEMLRLLSVCSFFYFLQRLDGTVLDVPPAGCSPTPVPVPGAAAQRRLPGGWRRGELAERRAARAHQAAQPAHPQQAAGAPTVAHHAAAHPGQSVSELVGRPDGRLASPPRRLSHRRADRRRRRRFFLTEFISLLTVKSSNFAIERKEEKKMCSLVEGMYQIKCRSVLWNCLSFCLENTSSD